jgi:hypothetical protein
MALFMIAACSSSNNPAVDSGGGSGGNTDGTVTATGSIGGIDLGGLDNATAAVVQAKGTGLDIFLSTTGADCAALTAGDVAGATYFQLFLTTVDGSDDGSAPTGSGTFNADTSSAGPNYVEADVEQLGSDCSQVTDRSFATGTVTLTALSGGVATGSFDLANGSDHSTGTFTTISCDGIATRDSGSAAPACH